MNASLLNTDKMLTLTQSLQLVGLVPCLFIVLFLIGLARSNKQVIVPACYFASLACGFALPLADIFAPFVNVQFLTGGLLFGESALAAFAFLLVLQFLLGRMPPFPYWLVLAIPLLGGGALIYASLMQGSEACLREQVCTDVQSVRTLYNVFASAMVFLLLVYYSTRFQNVGGGEQKRHKYALMVALIALHLFVLATDLARVSEHLTLEQARLIETVLRLTFIYVVLTSLFRVFYPALVTQIVQAGGRPYNPEADLPHVATLKALLEDGHVHREMRLNRARLAKKVGIGEHHLSRLINHHFKMSFNDLVNGYRIEEAKRRLKEEATPVTAIAFEVGFNSIASFNRVFKRRVGVSPTEYRSRSDQSRESRVE